ncbi:MAG: hypothetical protein LBJ59_08775 [Zoogloeaceae bacterium]|jgi:hypothetical protein|nr:hypothetical protein [Zoogloeaceae bacterium]
MNIQPHTPAEFTSALAALLPPGKAWEWKAGGVGHGLLHATAEEPARLESGIPGVLDHAVDTHRPKFSSWHIREYQRVAEAALAAAGITEALPRKPFAIGSHVGERLWSQAAPEETWEAPLVLCLHLFAPMTIGRHVGDGSGRDPAARMWQGERTRYILLVRYYKGVAAPKILWDALSDFQQSHVYLWFEDITGTGGAYAPD